VTAFSVAGDLRARARDARNRLIGSRRFRELAAKFPVFQYFADRSSRKLFSLATGFVHSQVLYALVTGGVVEALEAGPRSLGELAAVMRAEPGRAVRLLEAAAALGLLERAGNERYALGPLGAALCDNPGLTALIGHHAALYRDLEEPLALAADADRPTELGRLWTYAGGQGGAASRGDAEAYTSLMGRSQRLLATLILDAWPLERYARVMDVGGGDGTFLLEAAWRYPGLGLTLVDLPPVCRLAERRLAGPDAGRRIAIRALDAFREPLPGGHDAVTLVRVLHDHDDEPVAELLAACRAALPPGGELVIAEPMSDAPRAGPLIDAYFNAYLLAMGSGRPRRSDEYRRLLACVGFGRVRRRQTRLPLLATVLVARR